MRKIGNMPGEEEAYRFGDFLYVNGIENDVEHADADGFEIWVHEDAQLDLARKHFVRFVENPGAPEFVADREAEQKRKEEAREDAKRKSRVISRERLDYERNYSAFAWLPMVLAVLCLIATLAAGSFDFLPASMESQGFEKDEQMARKAAIF